VEERGGIARWLLFAAGIAILMFTLPKACAPKGEQPTIADISRVVPEHRAPERSCDLWGPRFRAQLTTRGAAVKSFQLTTAKYEKGGKPIELSSTPDHEQHRQLFFHFRNPAVAPPKDPKWNVAYDSVDWRLARADGKTCAFEYRDERVLLEKTVSVTERAYELDVVARIENLAPQKLTHAVTVETAAFRYDDEVSGSMFRQSPLITQVECTGADRKSTRLAPDAFGASEMKEEPAFRAGALNDGRWYQAAGNVFGAVSNQYFAHAVVPVGAPEGVACQLQIWGGWKDLANPSRSGAFYRARVAYPKRELEPGQRAEYRVLGYVGPKERDLLAASGGGQYHLDELLDLGFFSLIAKVLVRFLLAVHGVIPNWGIAIVILTITARTLLFPAMWPGIKNMIRMRELKPEMDALTEKFKDDPQQRGLAQMELWRKHNVNPLKGCLPQLLTMPVWFALYTTLQTAVELYNIPLLWFPDLSAPDPFYVLPFVIGGTSYVQQRLMPQQGDPMQQKMLLYFMPAMFTVFMLVLPAGLGIYMFTNGLIGILQHQIVEYYVRRHTRGSAGGTGGAAAAAAARPAPPAGSGKGRPRAAE
jgi:YidC/Oxa1 family membrane protein insertase